MTQMDSPGATHYHSTHVAGTMVAAGATASAKGMSFQGTLAAYDWDNDDSEMASAAASGMKISNHSYGYITGWYWNGDWYWWGDISISTTEDYGFGFYGSTAQAWDQIAYNAPYYTIVKSAGNDRNDSGPGPGGGHYVWIDNGWVWSNDTRDPDGGADGYDCISWNGTAKNIITVGAVSDIPGGYSNPGSVVMSSFSGWGPTDDGRIKPDVVANGISLYSCTDASNSSYASYSGTSMSSPNLSGSLNLLVQHYEATHGGTTPLSSTMKAILIQTADEAGPNPGPDYMFGWGLMNTLKAAQLIKADSQETMRIIEESLTNGETDEYFIYSNGTEPIRLTLAWTDPPGTSPTPSLNPTTAMLVNDLDLRLEHVDSATVYQPYVLDPNNPDNPASTGDNFRDNMEQVYVASPAAGNYSVTVTHKGTQSAAQTYSLVSSSKLYLNMNSFPNAYSLISPLEDDSVKMPVTLNWQTSVDPDPNDTVRYDLYLSRSLVFDPDSTDVYDSLPDTTFTDSLDLKLWYWKVKAFDEWGAERWSDQSWSFYVYLCGDCDGNAEINVSDVICDINYLFKGGFAPVPLVAVDVNCDGQENVSDVIYKLNYLFKGGPKPCQECP